MPNSPETPEQVRWVKEWPLHRSRLHLPTTREKYRGALLGLAAGDALGSTLEFKPPGTFAPLADMIGGGPFHLKPGEWADDTSMALCLAESLIEKRGFNAKDQMDRYCLWYERGHLSSTGGRGSLLVLNKPRRACEPLPKLLRLFDLLEAIRVRLSLSSSATSARRSRPGNEPSTRVGTPLGFVPASELVM
jgi:hypothetical protein